jgi:hypothetical protein
VELFFNWLLDIASTCCGLSRRWTFGVQMRVFYAETALTVSDEDVARSVSFQVPVL